MVHKDLNEVDKYNLHRKAKNRMALGRCKRITGKRTKQNVRRKGKGRNNIM
jgi:hypothetical protein